jgi:hypothetical protein
MGTFLRRFFLAIVWPASMRLKQECIFFLLFMSFRRMPIRGSRSQFKKKLVCVIKQAMDCRSTRSTRDAGIFHSQPLALDRPSDRRKMKWTVATDERLSRKLRTFVRIFLRALHFMYISFMHVFFMYPPTNVIRVLGFLWKYILQPPTRDLFCVLLCVLLRNQVFKIIF